MSKIADLLARFSKELGQAMQEESQQFMAQSLEQMMGGMNLEEMARVLAGGLGGRQASPYDVLGLSPSATDEEVRQRYRELVKRLHPDVAGKAGEHLFKLVDNAYRQICRERGQ